MWQVKTFKTKEAFQRWIDRNDHKMQWQELAVNNGYGVQYRRLLRVY